MRKVVCFFFLASLLSGCRQVNGVGDTDDGVLSFESPEEIAYVFAEKYHRHMYLKEDLNFRSFCIPEIIPALELEIPYIWVGRGMLYGMPDAQKKRDAYEFVVRKDETIVTEDGDETVIKLFYTEYEYIRIGGDRSISGDSIEVRVIRDKDGSCKISSYIERIDRLPGFCKIYMDTLHNGGDARKVLRQWKRRLDRNMERHCRSNIELAMLRARRKMSEEVVPYNSYGLDRNAIKEWALDNCKSVFPDSAIPGVPHYDFSTIPYNYDCTNFVSHALMAGGASMNDKGWSGITGDDQWYFRDNGNRSSSWAGVPYLYNFLTRSIIDDSNPGPFGEEMSNIYAEVGDVLQFYSDS